MIMMKIQLPITSAIPNICAPAASSEWTSLVTSSSTPPGSVLLSPDATCQFEHRPLQEQLEVCKERDSYRYIFQLLLQLKP
jgi:hypothetical protein